MLVGAYGHVIRADSKFGRVKVENRELERRLECRKLAVYGTDGSQG
jgi:hypothetical protein